MTDYGNSHKQREEEAAKKEKKIERITSSEVIIQKQGPWRKFRSLLIEADMGSVGQFIWYDILVPTMKNLLVDTVEQGIKRTVYGDRRASYRPPSQALVGRESRVSYNSPVIRRYEPDPRSLPQSNITALPMSTSRASNDPRGFIIASRDEAEQVIEAMLHAIDQYDVVTVMDLHEMLGLDTTPIDNNWGWDDLREAQIRQVREGWVLELPQAKHIR